MKRAHSYSEKRHNNEGTKPLKTLKQKHKAIEMRNWTFTLQGLHYHNCSTRSTISLKNLEIVERNKVFSNIYFVTSCDWLKNIEIRAVRFNIWLECTEIMILFLLYNKCFEQRTFYILNFKYDLFLSLTLFIFMKS